MAEHIGLVIKTESGNYALVVADRKGACGGCESTPDGCAGCIVSAKIESRVANPVGAQAGDLVKIRLSTANLFTGAAILYLLPVIGLLFGAFAGGWASTMFELAEIYASIAGAVVGLAGGYLSVIALDRSKAVRRKIMPTITSIVTPQVFIPDLKKATCCG